MIGFFQIGGSIAGGFVMSFRSVVGFENAILLTMLKLFDPIRTREAFGLLYNFYKNYFV